VDHGKSGEAATAYSQVSLLQVLENTTTSIIRFTGAVVVRMAYGYEVQDGDRQDPYIQLADEATEQFAISSAPGGFLVDVLPVCEYRFAMIRWTSQSANDIL
jgi:hypothetical protein